MVYALLAFLVGALASTLLLAVREHRRGDRVSAELDAVRPPRRRCSSVATP